MKIVRKLYFLIFLFSFSFTISCIKNESPSQEPFEIKIPEGFPEMVFSLDNFFTNDRWELGKKLFYEKGLSKDYSISCASCHQQALAFTDGLKKSEGIEKRLGSRNAPSLGNVGYHPYFLREGSVPTLEMQILVPIQEHVEFDFSMPEIVDRLSLSESYQKLAQKAYSRNFDAFVLTRAIACFERSLISGNSIYDKHFIQKTNDAISMNVVKGKDLFFSERTNCSQCHNGFNFTNYSFENNGLYDQYIDLGKQRATGKAEDNALFKVPSLRNVALTAPYMHDGSLLTLSEVIEHYNSGGKAHPHKNPLIKKLDLTAQEKIELKAFLESLTDQEFINNKYFAE